MAIELIFPGGSEAVKFERELPENYNGPLLRGSIALTAKTNSGQIIMQELRTAEYAIRFSVLKFFKTITAKSEINIQGISSHFILKHGIRKEIESIGRLHLRKDQYSCFYSAPTSCKARYEKNIEYRTLDIFYSTQLVEELLPFFPELKQILKAPALTVLPEKKCWMLPTMSEITNQLLHCPYDEATCQFYFDLKVRELLYQMLENAFNRKAAQHHFTPWEVSKIHDAKRILEGYISGKPPSFRSITRQVALNGLKLKTGFKQYFNMGLFEWLSEQKMQHAKDLVLNTNKPIKAIGQLVGYTRSTNFITAFRKRFGVTPRSLRG